MKTALLATLLALSSAPAALAQEGAPELTGAGWVNSPGLSLDRPRGSVPACHRRSGGSCPESHRAAHPLSGRTAFVLSFSLQPRQSFVTCPLPS